MNTERNWQADEFMEAKILYNFRQNLLNIEPIAIKQTMFGITLC